MLKVLKNPDILLWLSPAFLSRWDLVHSVPVAQDSLQPMVLQSQPFECLNHSCAPLHTVYIPTLPIPTGLLTTAKRSLWCLLGIRSFFSEHILEVSEPFLVISVWPVVPRVSSLKIRVIYSFSAPSCFRVLKLQRVTKCTFLQVLLTPRRVIHLDLKSWGRFKCSLSLHLWLPVAPGLCILF